MPTQTVHDQQMNFKYFKLTFGDGDILVGCGIRKNSKFPVVTFTPIDKKLNIGEDPGTEFKDFGHIFEMEFTNLESLQVLINALDYAKNKLEGKI